MNNNLDHLPVSRQKYLADIVAIILLVSHKYTHVILTEDSNISPCFEYCEYFQWVL